MSTSKNPDLWSEGKIILDEYQIESLLGTGGMGAVYLVSRIDDGSQFAMKILLSSALANPKNRRLFLRELRTWIDFPENPHIAACRFFRTVEDRLAIFSEYIDGGTLKQWITGNQLTDCAKILDIAIQTAYALQIAHDRGIVHQDVKPSNILITRDNTAKITDFGLAHARRISVAAHDPENYTSSEQVSSGGLTLAYCSPEQAMGLRVGRRTDMWSWGLTVLEMFRGRAAWKFGALAQSILASYREKAPYPPQPEMPESIAQMLTKCFMEEPSERWSSMKEIVQQLIKIYGQEQQSPYPRVLLPCPPPAKTVQKYHDRRTRSGIQWEDPMRWLSKALAYTSKTTRHSDLVVSERTSSRKAHAVADLELYEEAQIVYEECLAKGRRDLEFEYSELLECKAIVQLHVDDVSGALATYNHIVSTKERLFTQSPTSIMLENLTQSYIAKSQALMIQGDLDTAHSLCTRTITLIRDWLLHCNEPRILDELAAALMAKSSVCFRLNQHREALNLCDEALTLLSTITEAEEAHERQNMAALILMRKAAGEKALGDLTIALQLYDQAIVLLSGLIRESKCPEYLPNKALILMNKGVTLRSLGNLDEAITCYDEAIEIYRHLMEAEGRFEHANDLAAVIMNKAGAYAASHRPAEALTLYENSISILKRLVENDGRTDLSADLATATMNKANALYMLERHTEALPFFGQAQAIFERLVNKKKKYEFRNDLTSVYMNKSIVLNELGKLNEALDLTQRAVDIKTEMIQAEGKKEQLGDLAWIIGIRARTLFQNQKYDDALRETQRALEMLESEILRTGQSDLIVVKEELKTLYNACKSEEKYRF